MQLDAFGTLWGMEKKTARLSLKLKPSLAKRLKEMADANDLSVNKAVTKFIEAGLAKHEKPVIPPS